MPFVDTRKYYGDHWFELFYRASYESGKSVIDMRRLIERTLKARSEQTVGYHFCYLHTATGHTFRISTLEEGSEVYRCYNCGSEVAWPYHKLKQTVFCRTTFADGVDADLSLGVDLPRCESCKRVFPKIDETTDLSVSLPETLVGRDDQMIRYKNYAYYDNELLARLHAAGFDQSVTAADGTRQWAHIPTTRSRVLSMTYARAMAISSPNRCTNRLSGAD